MSCALSLAEKLPICTYHAFPAGAALVAVVDVAGADAVAMVAGFDTGAITGVVAAGVVAADLAGSLAVFTGVMVAGLAGGGTDTAVGCDGWADASAAASAADGRAPSAADRAEAAVGA